jgi:two-component system, chemotaxis family, protein-glutamate methylesterase/glutaminase
MSMKNIRLLIVDDSVLFRSQIQLALKDCPDIEIVGAASNGKIACDKMTHLDVDVCILDIEMPEMDGIQTLREMRTRGIKTKAIMFSSQSKAGAEKTLEAMKIGAYDFCPKPVQDEARMTPADKIREALLPKILALFGRIESVIGLKQAISTSINKSSKNQFSWEKFRPEVLVIASSTGGPNALFDFFSNLREPLPFPILVTQHMPPVFTTSFAERLASACGKICREAVHGEIAKPDHVYVAPGNFHMKLSGDKNAPMIILDQGPQRNFVRPCADFLFESAAKIYTKNTFGIVFTGMGRDGSEGCEAIKSFEGAVMIQTEESCVVFGMPGAVFDSGNFDYQGDPIDLARKTLAVAMKKRVNNVA